MQRPPLAMIKVSMADVARSRAFYVRLGFTALGNPADRNDPSIGALYGVDCAHVRTQILRTSPPLPLMLELLEWQDRHMSLVTFAVPGMGAIGLNVDSLDRVLADMASARVAPVGGIRVQPCSKGMFRLATARDSDDFLNQLVEFTAKAN